CTEHAARGARTSDLPPGADCLAAEARPHHAEPRPSRRASPIQGPVPTTPGPAHTGPRPTTPGPAHVWALPPGPGAQCAGPDGERRDVTCHVGAVADAIGCGRGPVGGVRPVAESGSAGGAAESWARGVRRTPRAPSLACTQLGCPRPGLRSGHRPGTAAAGAGGRAGARRPGGRHVHGGPLLCGERDMKDQMSASSVQALAERRNRQALLGDSGGQSWSSRAPDKYGRLDRELQVANSHFIEEQQAQQQLIVEQQDEQLELVSGSIGVLKSMSQRIGGELEEQAVMLDGFSHELESTQSRLDNVMKKLAKVSHMTSDRRQWCAIAVLFAVLLVVLILFLVL
uniref:t-SNARE coiled-coil homology domain-containing protein n=1 Tax=Oryctolagus cuniculus TaxID=9986 RepID=G1SMD4_RABIT